MRSFTLIAGIALAASLGACTSRTTYVERTAPPVVQQAPPATVVTPAPTVTVRPNY